MPIELKMMNDFASTDGHKVVPHKNLTYKPLSEAKILVQQDVNSVAEDMQIVAVIYLVKISHAYCILQTMLAIIGSHLCNKHHPASQQDLGWNRGMDARLCTAARTLNHGKLKGHYRYKIQVEVSVESIINKLF